MLMLTKLSLFSRRLFIAGVIIVLGISFAQLFRLVFPAPTTTATPRAATRSNIDADNRTNTGQLNSLATFKKIEMNELNQASIKNKANDTHLNLILVGVAESSDENSARAIIASGDKENMYAIGALLPGKNVSLAKVMSDCVVINNNGHYELLRLQNSNKSIPLQADLIEPSKASKDTPYVYGPPNGYIEALTDRPIERDQEQALVDINRNLLDVVAMSIHRIDSNRQLVGYKVQPGFDANKFKAVGLHADDMITAINGIPLTKPNEILESYKNRGNAPISLEIERGDSVVMLEVNQTL